VTPSLRHTGSDAGVAAAPSGRATLVVHRIDADDTIVLVDEAWRRFARANGAPSLAGSAEGRSLWDFVAGFEVRELHRILLQRVRSDGRVVEFAFRCDSPTLRRHLRMTIVALPGGHVEFRSRTLREEPRAAVPLLDAGATRTGEWLTMCSWCKRVKLDDWVEAEDAVDELGLFEQTTLPSISHGACPACLVKLLEEAKR
jgi:hypothetical protein